MLIRENSKNFENSSSTKLNTRKLLISCDLNETEALIFVKIYPFKISLFLSVCLIMPWFRNLEFYPFNFENVLRPNDKSDADVNLFDGINMIRTNCFDVDNVNKELNLFRITNQLFPCNFYKRTNQFPKPFWILVLALLPHWCKILRP